MCGLITLEQAVVYSASPTTRLTHESCANAGFTVPVCDIFWIFAHSWGCSAVELAFRAKKVKIAGGSKLPTICAIFADPVPKVGRGQVVFPFFNSNWKKPSRLDFLLQGVQHNTVPFGIALTKTNSFDVVVDLSHTGVGHVDFPSSGAFVSGACRFAASVRQLQE